MYIIYTCTYIHKIIFTQCCHFQETQTAVFWRYFISISVRLPSFLGEHVHSSGHFISYNVQLLVNTNRDKSNLLKFNVSIEMGNKGDLGDFGEQGCWRQMLWSEYLGNPWSSFTCISVCNIDFFLKITILLIDDDVIDKFILQIYSS